MAITKDLGVVTAYGYAVKHGYTGTEEEFGTQMNDVADTAGQAEAWAVGTNGGIPVTESDPQYHNNAKYYAEQAGEDAESAGTSEQKADASADTAEAWAVGTVKGVPVEEGQTGYNDNAKYYAGEASVSAEAAAASEQAAKDYSDHIADPVSGIVTEWLNDHVDPESQVVIDDSLTIAGAAADAKATGDAVADLKSALNWTEIRRIDGYTIVQGTGKWSYANNNWCYIIPIKTTDQIKLQALETNPALFTVLASYTEPVADATPNYAEGYSDVIQIGRGTSTDVTVPPNAAYLWIYGGYSSTSLFPELITIDGVAANLSVFDNIVRVYEDINNKIGETEQSIADTNDRIDETNATVAEATGNINDKIDGMGLYDVANNGMFETATENDASIGYIGSFKTGKAQRRHYAHKNIVAVNHDDLQPSDYLATRKIYNKFGYHANFNFILLPFKNMQEQETMIKNVKALVADGHDLGLHAIMGASFWWMNKMADVKANFTSTFFPSLDDLKTIGSDGRNVFGYRVTSTSKFTDIGFSNPPQNLLNVNVVDATATDYIYLRVHYTLYTMYLNTITGLDLDGNAQSWTGLHWLEYWYNNLIDPTLGYSNNSQALEANYLNDYQVPDGTPETSSAYMEYYPDAQHLLSGKVVRFDDTTNLHFSDPSYQKVGYFKKGLFKGAVSSCNYEVIDRCIDIAKAFCKHYFGIDRFTNFGRHGVRYFDCSYKNADYIPFDESTLTVLTGEVGKFYHSRSGKFLTEQDILLDEDIRMTNHNHPLNAIFEGQIGLYYGQTGNRYPFFNHAHSYSGTIDYLVFLGETPSDVSQPMDYETFAEYMNGRTDWMKFAYENAEQYITKPDGTGSMYVFGRIRDVINKIRGCIGTGKIPVFSWDTIKLNAATMAAVEIVCQYCYLNNIEIVPMEYARQMATFNDREYMQNWFPNPQMNQSVLRLFGGESTDNDAYIPDGWVKIDGSSARGMVYNVDEQDINGEAARVLTITMPATQYLNLDTRIYGLPSGKYKLSMYLKKTEGMSANCGVDVFVKKNSDFISRYYGDGNIKFNQALMFRPTAEWTEYTGEITIPERKLNMPSDSVASQYGHGYEDNVANVTIELRCPSVSVEGSLSIALPRLERVT